MECKVQSVKWKPGATLRPYLAWAECHSSWMPWPPPHQRPRPSLLRPPRHTSCAWQDPCHPQQSARGGPELSQPDHANGYAVLKPVVELACHLAGDHFPCQVQFKDVKSSSKTAPIHVTRSPRKAYREYRITGRCRSVSSAGHEERGCTKSKQQCCVQHVFSFTESSTNAFGDFVQPDGENGRMCQPGLLPPSPNPS